MSDSPHDSSSSTNWDIACFLLLVAVVLGLCFGGVYLIDHYVAPSPGETASAARGAFGDKFGALNAVFSALAFAGIIFTILLQRRELSFQRNEIRDSKQQIEKQNELIGRQRFESTFFNLLHLQGESTSRLELLSSRGGDACRAFHVALSECDPAFPVYACLAKLERESIRKIKVPEANISALCPSLEPSDVSTLSDARTLLPEAFETYLDDNLEMHSGKIKKAYEKVAAQYLSNFSHYFRGLFNIISLVDSYNDLDDDSRKSYAGMLRAQLSDAELVCLFYSCLTTYSMPGRSPELGYQGLGPLLVKYDFMRNMNWDSLIHPIHKDIFRKSNGGGV